jgi:hypothetical protein
MWYRIKKAQFGGGAIKSTPLLPVSSEQIEQEPQEELKDSPEFQNYDELNEALKMILEEMGQTLEEYYEMSVEQQRELWELLIKKPHHIGGSESLTDRDLNSYGDQLSSNSQRRLSPFHDSPENTTIEEQLDGSRHQNSNVTPINKQSSEAGNGVLLQTGIGSPSFFASSKSNPLFTGDLPSARTLI